MQFLLLIRGWILRKLGWNWVEIDPFDIWVHDTHPKERPPVFSMYWHRCKHRYWGAISLKLQVDISDGGPFVLYLWLVEPLNLCLLDISDRQIWWSLIHAPDSFCTWSPLLSSQVKNMHLEVGHKMFFSSFDSFCKSEQLRCIKQIDGDANWILLLLLQHLQLIGT